jgi:hypothetical protein
MPFFSLNPSTLHHPQSCTLKNGTEVFFNNTALDCSCLANIKADPDFAGPGLITSFTFICWLTIFVASAPTVYALCMTWKGMSGKGWFWKFVARAISFERGEEEIEKERERRRSNLMLESKALGAGGNAVDGKPTAKRRSAGSETDSLEGNPEKSTDNARNNIRSISKSQRVNTAPQLPASRLPLSPGSEPLWCIFSRRLVLQLCDLQIITGIAILVSALAQIRTLTFYHAQFATQFWWMTLNSFWVSRIDYTRDTPEMRTWRAGVRRLAIWVSVLLSCVMQSIVAYREYKKWDPLIAGRCYQANGAGTGFGQNVFWLAGSGLYLIVMTFGLFQTSRRWFDNQVNKKLEPSLQTMQIWMQESWRDARDPSKSLDGKITRGFFAGVWSHIRAAMYALAFGTWWCTVLFLSIWCAGNSAAVIELVVYSIFAGFLTWWIVFIKVQNAVLIRGDETRFTLGQTLPLFLLVLMAIHAVDVWAGVKGDDLKRRRRSIRGGEEQEPEGPMYEATNTAMAVTRPIEQRATPFTSPEIGVERRPETLDLERGEDWSKDEQAKKRGERLRLPATSPGLGIMGISKQDTR